MTRNGLRSEIPYSEAIYRMLGREIVLTDTPGELRFPVDTFSWLGQRKKYGFNEYSGEGMKGHSFAI